MLYLILRSIKRATSIGVSNLKDEIEKSTLSKFGKNVKYFIGYISSNYSIIIDKGERYYYYVHRIFRDPVLGPNSTFNSFIDRAKYDWDRGTEVPTG